MNLSICLKPAFAWMASIDQLTQKYRWHQFEKLLVQSETGFICGDSLEYRHDALELYYDYSRRKQRAAEARYEEIEKPPA
jgi:hypothetical protein